MLAEHGVEGDEFEDVDRLEVELGGDPLDALGRDVAEGLLPVVQEGERSAPFRDRVMGDEFVGLTWFGDSRRMLGFVSGCHHHLFGSVKAVHFRTLRVAPASGRGE